MLKKMVVLMLALVLVLSSVSVLAEEEADDSITMFHWSSISSRVDPNDNWAINQICEWADVKISKVYMPAGSDKGTQFNLLVASGDMPDLVETSGFRNDMRKLAEEGAFADITDVAFLKDYYSDIQLEAMKSSDGRIHVLDSQPINMDYDGIFLRVDLLEKAGYEGIPQTLDEFVAAMRAVKEWDPNALVYTCRSLNAYDWFLTDPFNTGTNGFRWYPERNAYCNKWEGDNVVKSVEFAKMLYDEGLLDKEFVTNDTNITNEKRLNENCLVWGQNRGGIFDRMQKMAKTIGLQDARFMPVPCPIDETCGRDAFYTAPHLYGSYQFAIRNGISEEKFDACVRLLETLYSDDVYQLYVYGREGIDYQVSESGLKTPIYPSAEDNSWREAYGIAWTCNSKESMNYFTVSAIYASPAFTDEQKEQYSTEFIAAMDEIEEKYLNKLDYSPAEFVNATPEIINATNECCEKQKNLYAEAVIGNITIDEFIAAKDELVEKYQFITDWWNEQIEVVLENNDLTYVEVK